jgi:hypothetical protein
MRDHKVIVKLQERRLQEWEQIVEVTTSVISMK